IKYMKKFLSLVGIIVILIALCLLIPWEHVNWGKISILPASTITVTGEAKKDELPQIANFSASVTATNVNKQTAINEVNTQMTKIIQAVKDFGIDQKDIQTQQVSVYQTKEERLSVKDVWQASNSISIKLRNINQASALTDLLQQSNTTNVYGPNYSLDDTTQAQVDLLSKAIDNAREKAEKIAVASKRKLGKIITLSEGGTVIPGPVFRSMSVAETISTPVEPGTETVYQSVTVTFELK
ncbi:SIMPL domain-containing protein, partial [Microgenomates group bacterium]|nr:SIMPL domain-containing protein [Microgenomates group bacterium]